MLYDHKEFIYGWRSFLGNAAFKVKAVHIVTTVRDKVKGRKLS
jgi:hypothetical protein